MGTMSLGSWETINKFEMLGNGSATQGYATFQLNNFNVEGLILANVVLLLLLNLAPYINRKLEPFREVETIETRLGEFEFYTVPSARRVIESALFLLNFSSLFTVWVVPYVIN